MSVCFFLEKLSVYLILTGMFFVIMLLIGMLEGDGSLTNDHSFEQLLAGWF
jgi:hypothetical protein